MKLSNKPKYSTRYSLRALAHFFLFSLLCFTGLQAEVLQVGDKLNITLKGVPENEQGKVNSVLTVRDDGLIRIPMINKSMKAAGLKPSAVERNIEQAFIKAQIYTNPTISINVQPKKDKRIEIRHMLSVGGEVRRNGPVQYREGMTLLQAIQQAGGRTPFASKYVILTRNKKRYLYNIKTPAHQQLKVREGDTVQVPQQNGIFDKKPKL